MLSKYNLRIELIDIYEKKIVKNDAVLQQVKSFVVEKGLWKKIFFSIEHQSVFMGDLICYSESDKDLNIQTKCILNMFAENELKKNENLGLQFYIFKYLDI